MTPFRSGAYLGSHSTVSQGRTASASRLVRLVWIGPLSSTSTTGRLSRPGTGPWDRSSRPSRPTKSAERFIHPAGVDGQVALGVAERAEERALRRPSRRLDPRVGPARGPAVRQVGG